MKLASTHYYDELPTTGNEYGRAFRDIELEKQVLEEAHKIGLGAQFGGKYLHTTYVSSACPVTVHHVPSVWEFLALPTVTSNVKSTRMVSG